MVEEGRGGIGGLGRRMYDFGLGRVKENGIEEGLHCLELRISETG